jgi:hypothetical protein
VSEDLKKSGFDNSGVLRTRKLLHSGIAISRNAISRQLKERGATGISGGQVALVIGVRGKESPETLDIRIRDIAKSEIPTR